MELVKERRASLAAEFVVIDKLVDANDECATWRHPEHPELTSATFAKVLLVMYGALRAQGKLAAFFRDNDVTNGERMFFFAVGTCLDSAIDTAEPMQGRKLRSHADAEPEEIAAADDSEREANALERIYEPDPRD